MWRKGKARTPCNRRVQDTHTHAPAEIGEGVIIWNGRFADEADIRDHSFKT